MSDWAGRRVLITGHRGFIGGALTRRLRESGAEVWGCVRDANSDAGSEIPVRVGDLSSLEFCRRLVADCRPDHILHLAGHPFGARDLARIMPTFRDNLATTVNILTSAAEIGVGRIVVTGSLEEPDIGEDDPRPSSPYAASKWAASMYARLFHRLYDLPVVIARVFMVYGPGQSDPQKLIPSVITSLLNGESPKITSGERPVDWVYVDDVVEGMVRAAEKPELEGCTVELGTGVLTTVREVVEHLVRLVPGAPPPLIGALPTRAFEQVRAARAEATCNALDWTARVTLEQGLARTVDWFRAKDNQDVRNE